MTEDRSSGRGRVVRTRRSPSPADAAGALAEIDHRLLGVLCTHRVVRQDQLARLFPEMPERTLRYRTRRLHDLGLAGRSRPYRESGSAPNHHWPTRRADCLVRGEPLPRGGERKTAEPDVPRAHGGADRAVRHARHPTPPRRAVLELSIYRGRAKRARRSRTGAQERTLAPDAMVVLIDEEGRKLGAFVEIDLGTMSHTRLRCKAGLYAAYAKSDAWRERHLFLPALLFLTTTDTAGQPGSSLRWSARCGSPHGATSHARVRRSPRRRDALARTPRLLDEACLADLDGHDGLTAARRAACGARAVRAGARPPARTAGSRGAAAAASARGARGDARAPAPSRALARLLLPGPRTARRAGHQSCCAPRPTRHPGRARGAAGNRTRSRRGAARTRG